MPWQPSKSHKEERPVIGGMRCHPPSPKLSQEKGRVGHSGRTLPTPQWTFADLEQITLDSVSQGRYVWEIATQYIRK